MSKSFGSEMEIREVLTSGEATQEELLEAARFYGRVDKERGAVSTPLRFLLWLGEFMDESEAGRFEQALEHVLKAYRSGYASGQKGHITFEPRCIQVTVGSGLREVDAVVGVGTAMAYHPVPTGTILYKKLPNALMITELQRHSSVTCATFPADAPTAQACIAYLCQHAESQTSPLDLIDRFAHMQGCWYRL